MNIQPGQRRIPVVRKTCVRFGVPVVPAAPAEGRFDFRRHPVLRRAAFSRKRNPFEF